MGRKISIRQIYNGLSPGAGAFSLPVFCGQIEAIEKKLSARDIAHTIHAHPTLAEGIMEAAEDVHGSAIHSPKT